MIHGLYGLVATDELDESFYALLPLMQGAVVESKQRSILATWAYMAGKANVNGIEFGQKDVLEPGVPEIKQPTPGFDVNPWLLNAPNAASGMSISEINARAPYGVKALIKQGMPPKQALRVSEGRMIALSKTESPLMSRLIPGTVVETRAVTGFARYRRVPAPGACDYCLAQAQRGAVFHSEQLAQGSHLPGGGYHANCVPADSVVSSPGTEAATRRWWEGELVVIKTSSGKKLRITPNHPVLTLRGWVAAKDLSLGDNVVDGSRLDWERLNVPDEDNAPSVIADVYGSFGMLLTGVESSTQDFYGDGTDGDVDIVLSDSFFRDELNPYSSQGFLNLMLARAAGVSPFGLLRDGSSLQGLESVMAASPGVMSSFGPVTPLGGSGLFEPFGEVVSDRSSLDALLSEAPVDSGSGDVVFSGEFDGGVPPQVVDSNVVAGDVLTSVTGSSTGSGRFDPGSFEPVADRDRMYSELGGQLLERLAGQAEHDRIVDYERVSFRGHVFDLQTTEGWFVSDGLIISNCRCTTQLITDVDEKNAIAIHPDDMRKIETKFDRKGRVWKTDLNSNWNQYRNRPESRPPDIEFLPLQSVE